MLAASLDSWKSEINRWMTTYLTAESMSSDQKGPNPRCLSLLGPLELLKVLYDWTKFEVSLCYCFPTIVFRASAAQPPAPLPFSFAHVLILNEIYSRTCPNPRQILNVTVVPGPFIHLALRPAYMATSCKSQSASSKLMTRRHFRITVTGEPCNHGRDDSHRAEPCSGENEWRDLT